MHGVTPIAKVAKRLRRHLDNILTYLDHQLTNAVARGSTLRMNYPTVELRGIRGGKHYLSRTRDFTLEQSYEECL
jgi:hypothetical protein